MTEQTPSTAEVSHTREPAAGVAGSRDVVLELANVSKIYSPGDPPAVNDISLQVRSGEFFSILGPSGSGKTTTLRVIAGFERPTAGRVSLGGADVTRVHASKRDVNTVFQQYALFPHMTVEENVAYPLKMARVPRGERGGVVNDMLERVEMTGYEKRRPHQLSGGQRQRIALARALAAKPKVLLLDEPLGALDLKLRENMLLVLRHLQRETGITFVYVTHDQAEALGMSDRLAVMNNGHIEQIASPDDVYRKPRTSFVARFIGKTNLLNCAAGSNGTVRVGQLAVRVANAPQSEDFIISLRPEDIALGPASENLDNHFVAEVQETLFLGHEQQVLLSLDGQSITARAAGREPILPGQSVPVGWSAQAAVVVKETDHSAVLAEDGA